MDDGKHSPKLDWKGAVPVALSFDDPYFSLEDGLAETEHVFLGGNDLRSRMRDGFHIAELGFGTGLNALVTADLWASVGQRGRLSFTSFEAFPMGRSDMARALDAFPTLGKWAEQLLNQWPGPQITLGTMDLRVVQGDARASVAGWDGAADAWFLDGFSPAKNTELWEPALMAQVARHTRAGGTFATYTAAGHVRRALTAAGFAVERVPGYGRKRHMTRGRLA